MAGDDDCAICFEAMTTETGHTVLGCGHRFHMLCVVNWYQDQEGTPTCPCCRRQAGRFDNVPVWPEDAVDGDEDARLDWLDEDVDVGDARIVWQRAEGGQWECYRIPNAPDFVWDPDNQSDGEEVPAEMAAGAVALQRVWRGWRERRALQDAKLLVSVKITALEMESPWIQSRFLVVV
jgi:hypothetical protein